MAFGKRLQQDGIRQSGIRQDGLAPSAALELALQHQTHSNC